MFIHTVQEASDIVDGFAKVLLSWQFYMYNFSVVSYCGV